MQQAVPRVEGTHPQDGHPKRVAGSLQRPHTAHLVQTMEGIDEDKCEADEPGGGGEEATRCGEGKEVHPVVEGGFEEENERVQPRGHCHSPSLPCSDEGSLLQVETCLPARGHCGS